MAVSEVFVDTGAWYALTDSSDHFHLTAREIYPRLLGTSHLITTNLVISETYTLLQRHLGVPKALIFLELVRSSPRIEIIYSTRDLEIKAGSLLSKYGDQPLSYTDAVSFACMLTRNIDEAFSFDHHFLLPGFRTTPSL